MGNRKKKDGRQNNGSPNPKTKAHFIHIAKKNKRQDDAIYGFEVSDECYPESRKFAHHGDTSDVGKRCAYGAKDDKIANV